MKRFHGWWMLWLVAAVWSLGAGVALGEVQADAKRAIPPGRTEYLGRRIAQTMHWTGAEWLIRETREKEEHPAIVMKQLSLKPGMTAADIGCGNGFYTLRLAEAVAPGGKAYGVEVQPQYFPMLKRRAAAKNIQNIETVLGTLVDPKLPAGSCDVILLADVYHEFSHPRRMLAAIRRALKPTGYVVLLEFRAEDPAVPIKPLHKMSKDQVNRELTANGFRLAKQFDGLPWQHMMFFMRDDAKTPTYEKRNDHPDTASKHDHNNDKDEKR